MARAFTEKEKADIKEQLLETGQTLFSRYGLKKTSIEDLTGPAGIAKSSFYLFFDSKEDLYLELLRRQGPEIEERVLGSSFRATGDVREGIVRFLRAIIEEMETNPLIRQLLTRPEELEWLARRLTPEQLEARLQSSMQLIQPYVEQGQAAGQIIAGDPEVIAGAIRSVTLLTLHQKDIGEGLYPKVLDLMIELVAGGLTKAA